MRSMVTLRGKDPRDFGDRHITKLCAGFLSAHLFVHKFLLTSAKHTPCGCKIRIATRLEWFGMHLVDLTSTCTLGRILDFVTQTLGSTLCRVFS